MSWAFWALAALLTAASVGLLLHPLLRRPHGQETSSEAAADRSDYDLQVYRDQLDEIARDRERGVLTAAEAEAAALEVQRRLLAADRRRTAPGPSAKGPPRRAKIAALAVTILLPFAGMGLYLLLGSPDMPSLPLAQRGAEVERVAEMRELTDQLQLRLEQNPDDPRGWELLARGRAELGQWPEAAQAYREALERGDSHRADLHSALGEAVTAAAGGTVTPQARAAFETALDLNPEDPRALYYRGLALQQAGRPREALDLWMALAETTPRDAGWRPLLRQQIAGVANELGLPVNSLRIPEGPPATPAPAPAPSGDGMAAMEEMDPDEREAFVRSMVDRLAERLERQPEDIDGWLRLVQARLVLGENDEALAALRRAAPLVEDLPEDDQRRRAVDEGLRLLQNGP